MVGLYRNKFCFASAVKVCSSLYPLGGSVFLLRVIIFTCLLTVKPCTATQEASCTVCYQTHHQYHNALHDSMNAREELNNHLLSSCQNKTSSSGMIMMTWLCGPLILFVVSLQHNGPSLTENILSVCVHHSAIC